MATIKLSLISFIDKYINFVIEQNKNIYISYWLLLITFLVALMIVVGGLTRLTDSGLSITKWNLISGILPPFTLSDWEKSFNLYKQIPEYKIINSTMTLDQFKVIYWWEYSHRLLGRIIGLFYLIPLFYFTFKKLIKKESLISLYLILALIFFQGFIGWYMVKSGLTDRTDVSHYRLSLHLILAFLIFILLLWNYLKYKNQCTIKYNKNIISYLLILFIFFISLQICIGAFVSGLDAGKIYQTWPLMNENYYPDDSNLKDLFTIKSLETPSIVQFLHRNLAYLIFFMFAFILAIIFRSNDFFYLRKTSLVVLLFLFLQIFLGILTIISGAHIIVASMHQMGSILLIAGCIILLFKNFRIN